MRPGQEFWEVAGHLGSHRVGAPASGLGALESAAESCRKDMLAGWLLLQLISWPAQTLLSQHGWDFESWAVF